MRWLTFGERGEARPAGGARVAPVMTGSEFARKCLGFEPDEKQQQVLDSGARRGILNCSRQWGKSTVTAAMALHRAWMERENLVLVASRSLRQSGEFLKKVERFARKLGVRVRGDGENDLSVLLPNGSRIIGLPSTESTVRGFSGVTLLLIDEAAQVSDTMYKTLRPMLAVRRGALWLMSTPYGRQGFFYEEWTHGGERWERVMVKAAECERIPKDFLEEEREAQGSAWFRQEYCCEFVDNGTGWFERGVVEAALSDDEPVIV